MTLPLIRQLAQVFGEVEDVAEVIIQGGVRTSGAPWQQSHSDQGYGEAMTTMIMSGWKIGFQKIRFTQLLQREFDYSLTRAKDITDTVVERRTVELQVAEDRVEQLLLAMTQLGAEYAAPVPAR